MDDFCTKAMRTRIQEHPDFSTQIQDDPIKLLETIKSGMQEPVRAQYPLITSVDHTVTMFTCKQGPDEQLIDFSKQFKQNLDLAIEHISKSGVNHCVENQADYLAAAYHPPALLKTKPLLCLAD